MECKCSMRIKLVGDGCEVCNPEYAASMTEAAQTPPPIVAKCDGNHGGPRCCGPECWNNEAPTQRVREISMEPVGVVVDEYTAYGECICMTKTPDPAYHDDGCTYKELQEMLRTDNLTALCQHDAELLDKYTMKIQQTPELALSERQRSALTRMAAELLAEGK